MKEDTKILEAENILEDNKKEIVKTIISDMVYGVSGYYIDKSGKIKALNIEEIDKLMNNE